MLQVHEANAQLAEQDAEVTPVQRRIEPRSADDSLSGVVRCLCFADTFLRDGMNKSLLCSAIDAYSIHRFPAKQGLCSKHKISKQKSRIAVLEIFQDHNSILDLLKFKQDKDCVNVLRHNSYSKCVLALTFKCTAMQSKLLPKLT